MHDTKSIYELYGEVAWLWSNSELHLSWSIRTQSYLIIPPIKLNQYLILYDEEQNPVAYCSWAYFDQAAEANYILQPGKIHPSSWNIGNRLWLIDFISPFSTQYTLKIRRQLSDLFPLNIGAALRVKPHEEVGKIITYCGVNLAKDEAIQLRMKRLKDAETALRIHPDRDNAFKLNYCSQE